MASSLLSMALLLAFYVSVALGETVCERLGESTCAYAVSSSGMRCVLEKRVRRGGQEKYVCRASEIEADGVRDWVETDECIGACGLDRSSLGISSDSLLESRFTEKLCSARCSLGCPNIVDLYFNLAAAEGVFLPKLCEARRANPRRAMGEIRSSGTVTLAAGGPTAGAVFASGPGPTSGEVFAAGPAESVSYGRVLASPPVEPPM